MNLNSISKNFPGFDKIYSIRGPFNRRAFRGTVNLEEFKGFKSADLFWGKAIPVHPITIMYDMGTAFPGDVIQTSMGGAVSVISEKVLLILKNNSFTGWSTYPVRVYAKSGHLIEGYHGLSITGRCGQVEYSRSRVEIRQRTPTAIPFKVYIGEYFDESSWDGSDLFSPEGTTTRFVVQRVVDAFKAAKIKNIEFQRITEEETSVRSVKSRLERLQKKEES